MNDKANEGVCHKKFVAASWSNYRDIRRLLKHIVVVLSQPSDSRRIVARTVVRDGPIPGLLANNYWYVRLSESTR
jgi:hypothetical protein